MLWVGGGGKGEEITSCRFLSFASSASSTSVPTVSARVLDVGGLTENIRSLCKM